MNDNPYSVGEQLILDPQSPQGKEFKNALRGLQIVAAALMAGVLIFLPIVLVITRGIILEPEAPGFLAIFGAGFGAFAVFNHFIFPAVIARARLKQMLSSGFMDLEEMKKSEQIFGVYRSQLIVALSFLEGAAFLNLVMILTERSIVSTAVVIVLLGFMVFRFPTRDRVSFWVQDKLREMQM